MESKKDDLFSFFLRTIHLGEFNFSTDPNSLEIELQRAEIHYKPDPFDPFGFNDLQIHNVVLLYPIEYHIDNVITSLANVNCGKLVKNIIPIINRVEDSEQRSRQLKLYMSQIDSFLSIYKNSKDEYARIFQLELNKARIFLQNHFEGVTENDDSKHSLIPGAKIPIYLTRNELGALFKILEDAEILKFKNQTQRGAISLLGRVLNHYFTCLGKNEKTGGYTCSEIKAFSVLMSDYAIPDEHKKKSNAKTIREVQAKLCPKV